MSSDIRQHPKVQALIQEFGSRVKIEGVDSTGLKNCLYVRADHVYDGKPPNRRLIRRRITIQALNAAGKPVNFQFAWDKSVPQKLTAALPELTPQLAGGEPTHRRQKLASLSDTFQREQSAAATDGRPARLQAFESLDTTRPGFPPNLSPDYFRANNTSTLPTAVTWIDTTDPEKPRRVIFLIEQDVGKIEGVDSKGNRVDYTIISYEMGDTEKAAMRNSDGTYKSGFRQHTESHSVDAKNTTIKNVDPNGYISGDEAADHHTKTIKSTLAAANFLNDEFHVRIDGPAELTMMDTLQNPNEGRVLDDIDGDKTTRSRVSIATRAPEVDSSDTRTISRAEVEFDYDKQGKMTGTRLKGLPELVRVFDKIPTEGLKKIREQLASLQRFLGAKDFERPRTMLRRK